MNGEQVKLTAALRPSTRRGSVGFGRYVSRGLLYLLLVAVAAFTVGPYYWMLKTSLETAASVYAFPPKLVPWPLTLENFKSVWESLNLYQYFMNSIIITASGIAISVIFAAMFAYPLARYRFPGRNLLFFLVLLPMMVPVQGGFIINFLTAKSLHLVNTYAGVVLPNAITLFGIFLLRQSYLNIPSDFEDAARIDGAGEFYIWWRIMLPMIKPSLATLTLLQFLAFWNNFLWPLVILRNPNLYPLSVGLLYLNNTFQTNFRSVAAGAIIATLPVVALFLFLQQYFVRGLTAGGVKY